jgi:hypothetical protein
MKIQKTIDLIITFVVWFLVSMPIHEFFHYIAAMALGGKGMSIIYSNPLSGWCSVPSLFPHMWVAYLAGGVGTALVMFLLAWRALLSPTKWDEDEVFSLFILGGAQFGYGVAEVSLLYYPYWFNILAPMGAFAGSLLFGIWRIPKALGWIMGDVKEK